MLRKTSTVILAAAAAATGLLLPVQASADAAPTSITCSTADGIVYNDKGWEAESNWLSCTDGHTATVSEVGGTHRDGTGNNSFSCVVTWSDGSTSFIAGQEVSDTPLGAGEVAKFTGTVVYGTYSGYTVTEQYIARDSGNSATALGIIVLQKA